MASQATPIAVFDISSSSVGGAHALITTTDNKTSVRLMVQERRDSGLDDEINIVRFVDDTAKALEVVIDHVRNADVHHPEAIQVVLGSPWYTSYTRTITYNKTPVFTCTKRLVDSLIEKEIESLLKETSAAGDAFGDSFKVVEQQVSRISLNGYSTTDPYGKKVQSMEIVLMVTLVPEVVVERFTGILRRSYGDRTIHVTTGLHAAYVALRDNGGVQSNCVIVDVGEEVTDIAFVKDNLFVSQHSFPLGVYELYRSLSSVTGSSLEARALVEAYRLDKLSPNNVRIVEKAINAFALQWQKLLHEVVAEGTHGFHVPPHWYIVGDQRFEALFTGIISSDTFLQHASTAPELVPVFLNTLKFSAQIQASAAETPDPSLAIGALFIDRLI
ncbi:MAG: hypothetical protein JWL92_239 [Candidatus Nomurabacteria bacterium]|nr:hypothetical protein [Candidatus Nomurabacteria bacterium]